ncbi:MoxR family ATPase [Streptomyces sp. NPDC004610]|uniref:AAA family ATPase n=1 Tax=unclassified Streptomyces TaxID=2593676 RepID=UPI0033B4425B
MSDWHIYQGHGHRHDGIDRLPAPPPWRAMSRQGTGPGSGSVEDDRYRYRAAVYQSDPGTVDAVNAALLLRRPLLVTGRPGTGKSTLAHQVAHELGLGPVLRWAITSRSTLKDGLYIYDAIGRLQEASRRAAALSARRDGAPPPPGEERSDIGSYLRLGPLGTALLPAQRPRVLLIDEVDKSDLDLPNDLLHVFEDGDFEIPELVRLTREPTIDVLTSDGRTAPITEGRVQCTVFPLVILTSNGEREFPAAFLRRCVSLRLPEPDMDKLARIVEAHLGRDGAERGREIIEIFLRNRAEGLVSTDQLLNAIYLATGNGTPEGREELVRLLLRPLGPGT